MCGPSGAGKSTIAAAVAARLPAVFLSVSATTRTPRSGEIDGTHYRFVSEAEFAAMEQRGEFLETATVFGSDRYGTPSRPVRDALAAGRPVLLEIDVQGARAVKQAMPEAVTVFVEPPSWEALEARLRGRRTEDAAAMQRRLSTARAELAQAPDFDRRVVNDRLDDAVEELVRIVQGE